MDMTKLTKDHFIPEEEPLNVLRRSPQFPYPLHNHDFSELVIVYGGEGLHFSGQTEHRIEAGDAFVINGSVEHGYRDTRDLCLVNILFLPENMNLSLLDLPMSSAFHLLFTLEPEFRDQCKAAGYLHLTPEQLSRAMSLVDTMESELQSRRKGYRMLVAGCFMQLAALLIRYYEDPERPIPQKMLKMSEIMVYLHRNYHSRISIEQLCASAGMSESTLSRAFKQAVGTTPLDYCNRLRLRRAAELLRNTDMSIAEIAEHSGFDDSNYFSRTFRRQLGLSPRIYRQQKLPR
jgi:AraC family L-rhamnose operon transcriptional activator RhaR/AraC family L-rhamnose operon regulatory protein RhaS